MKALEARDLWIGELNTNGASPWTIRNYKSATDVAFVTIAKRRDVAATLLEVTDIDRDDLVASLAGHIDIENHDGQCRKRAQSMTATFSTALRSFFSWCVETREARPQPNGTGEASEIPSARTKGNGE